MEQLQLSDWQSSFIFYLVHQGKGHTEAAHLAGFAAPRQSAFTLTQSPKFEIRFKLWLTQIVIFTFAMIQAFVYTTYFENTEILLIFIAWFAMIVVAITSKKEKTHLVISILYFLFIIMLVINDLEDENSLAEFWRLPS